VDIADAMKQQGLVEVRLQKKTLRIDAAQRHLLAYHCRMKPGNSRGKIQSVSFDLTEVP
jgi:hypothetical protein